MLTQERLRYLLWYNPETGEWRWLNPPNHNTRLRGQIAGNRRPDGYLKIRIGGFAYYSSHLACLYMLGHLPAEEMDHKDRDPSNDRWHNLREATSSENKWNRQNRALYRGVYPCGKKWQVMAGRAGYLGVYDSLEEAMAIRDAAALSQAGEFAILNNQETYID